MHRYVLLRENGMWCQCCAADQVHQVGVQPRRLMQRDTALPVERQVLIGQS